MNTNWPESMLQEVADVVNGGTPKTKVSDFWGGDHLWITPAEMGKLESPYLEKSRRTLSEEGLKNSSASLVPAYSVILSTRAPIGHLAINTKPMAFNQGCRGIVPGDSLHHKFLYYFFVANVRRLDDLGSGTTFKELSASKLKKFSIPVPPMDEQKRIVAILDEAFAGIGKAIANTENNIANARELFESELKMQFEMAIAKSGLIRIDDVAEEVTDGDHMPPPKSEDGIPFITIRNIEKSHREIDFSDTFKVPVRYYNSLKKKRKPKRGDVLYTVTGSFGIPVLVKWDRKFCFQRHIALIRPKSNYLSEWLEYALLSPQVFDQANQGATGTAQKTVSLGVLREILIPDQDIRDQEALIRRLDAVLSAKRQLEAIYEQKLSTLDELKRSILGKAFSGELATKQVAADRDEAVA